MTSLSFLGPLGGPEIIMILVVLVLVVAPAIFVIWLVIYLNKPKPALPPAAPPPLPAKDRLEELESLKTSGLISEEEYRLKRDEIVGGL